MNVNINFFCETGAIKINKSLIFSVVASSVGDPNPRGSELFFAISESFVPDSDPVPDPVIK